MMKWAQDYRTDHHSVGPVRRIVGSVLFLLMAGVSSTLSQQSVDTFSRIQAMHDSLFAWSNTAPVINASPDSVDLAYLFPDAVLKEISVNAVLVELPQYAGWIQSNLIVAWNSSSMTCRLDTLTTDSSIFVDGQPLPNVHPDDKLFADYVLSKLCALRTVGVPSARAQISNQFVGEDVAVTLVGRDLSHFQFSSDRWWKILRRLSQDRLVYSHLLNVIRDQNHVTLDWAVLITSPKASGHHFIRWREDVELTADGIQQTNSEVRFLPYVRMDNVSDLFARSDSSGHFDKKKVLRIRQQ